MKSNRTRRPRGLRPALRSTVRLGAGVSWFDDYFAHQRLDSGTVAILEPRYHQENVNYLIEGSDRALLLDTGPGLRDITPVARQLSALPLTVTCSHLHYDHVGNLDRFADVRLLDLPLLRAMVVDGVLVPPRRLHGGVLEGISRPAVRVAGWYLVFRSFGAALCGSVGDLAGAGVEAEGVVDAVFGGACAGSEAGG